MATGDDPRVASTGGAAATTGQAGGETARGQSEQAKAAFLSTELWVFLGLVVGLIVASIVGGFGLDRFWLFLTLLTVGYLVSRGFAKALSGEGPDEIKPSFKTTELWVFAAALIALFVTGLVTRGEHFGELACAYLVPPDQCDSLDADRIWFYATLLGIGYLVSRGLAKSGGGQLGQRLGAGR